MLTKSQVKQFAQQVVDGSLTDDEHAALMCSLQKDQNLHHIFIDYMMLHAQLSRELGAGYPEESLETFIPSLEPQSNSAPITMASNPTRMTNPTSWHLGWYVVLGTTAAALLFVAGWQLRSSRDQIMASASAPMIHVAPVAYLASSTGCEWDGPEPNDSGTSFQQGQTLTLLEGIAEFRLASGVSLNMEGPACVVLHSPTFLELRFGRLTCYVPWVVAGVHIDAGGKKISACDAEYGVNVTTENISVHAFSGHVIVSDTVEENLPAEVSGSGDLPSDARRFNERRDSDTVAAGRAITYDLFASSSTGTLAGKRHRADATQFATRLLMADELPITRKYVDAVMQSQPIAYWRFESLSGGIVQNEIPGGAALKIVGELGLSDNNANRVAEFGRPGVDCFLTNFGPLGLPGGTDYSIELWIKPSHVHRAGLVSLLANPHESDDGLHAFYLELEGAGMPGIISRQFPGRIRMLHRDPPSRFYRDGTSCFSDDPYLIRRWQQVVAVKEKGVLHLYVNKKVVATGFDESALADDLHLVVGRAVYSNRAFPFVGQLDELAIYSRALSEDEVAKHYNCVWKSFTQDGTARAGRSNI